MSSSKGSGAFPTTRRTHRIVSGKDLGPDVQAHGAPELGHDLDPFLGVGEGQVHPYWGAVAGTTRWKNDGCC
jgi:hypothetical protein